MLSKIEIFHQRSFFPLGDELGNTDEALDAVNVTRGRAGLPDITVTDKDELRKAIQREDSDKLRQHVSDVSSMLITQIDHISSVASLFSDLAKMQKPKMVQ